MFARITKYKMKPGTRDATTKLLESLKSQIMALDGMRHFINAINEDGSGYVISVVESKAKSDANAPQVAALWANFAEYLEAAPVPEGYEVIADWKP